MGQEPLEITEMHVATQAHLAEHGHEVTGAYNVTMVRVDGEVVASQCDAASMVANLIQTLNPPRIFLMVATTEDHAASSQRLPRRRCVDVRARRPTPPDEGRRA